MNNTNYIPVKIEFDYCIMDEKIKRKGFSDKLCEHMKKEDAEYICKALNNYDALLSALKDALEYLPTWAEVTTATVKKAIKNAEQ